MAKLTLLLNILGSPRRTIHLMHAEPSSTMSSISAIVPRSKDKQRHLLPTADEVAVLWRRLSSPNVAYLNILVMGEIAPPAILHSTDINRSSQDTQQLRASQTEPVRHGAGGGSTTRHNSLQPALGRATVPKKGKKKNSCHLIFTYLREEPHEVNHLTPNTGSGAESTVLNGLG